ncbi:hypothetical protein [Nakamurella endophytica]|uniref:Uncharacterized protein n=1 Tax=Nakamurella endophytica TaxID=1748367 RepID=A0A917T218_9ACTN|nr:hypothetical protein [Nakamurella endophytica]GGM06266.1 hypothetical protein GCM10011594_28040 [Nakamurella endophytica]
MALFGRRSRRLPPPVAARVAPDERVLAVASLAEGDALVATRFGLWWQTGDDAVRWDWHGISRAALADRVLTVTLAERIDVWPDGTELMVDLPPRRFTLADRTVLTDVVHARVRGSVAVSAHLPHPAGGAWLVWRRVAGRDGLTRQVRLDPGTDAAAPGFAAAAAAGLASLRPDGAGAGDRR